jgi:hypothetical protein
MEGRKGSEHAADQVTSSDSEDKQLQPRVFSSYVAHLWEGNYIIQHKLSITG